MNNQRKPTAHTFRVSPGRIIRCSGIILPFPPFRTTISSDAIFTSTPSCPRATTTAHHWTASVFMHTRAIFMSKFTFILIKSFLVIKIYWHRVYDTAALKRMPAEGKKERKTSKSPKCRRLAKKKN